MIPASISTDGGTMATQSESYWSQIRVPLAVTCISAIFGWAFWVSASSWTTTSEIKNINSNITKIENNILRIEGRLDRMEVDMGNVKTGIVRIEGRLDRIDSDIVTIKTGIATLIAKSTK